MSSFTETIVIDASAERVWDTLADIGTIADWNPGLVGSHATNKANGLGATRYCDIDGKHNLDEEVVCFEPLRAITFRITRSTLPFRSADIRFTLKERSERTVVSVSPIYELKYGFAGRLLDRTFVSTTYKRGMRGLLKGLKTWAERG
ncbi:MAG: SRPBCC family protein [Pseudoruegeria sp.]